MRNTNCTRYFFS
uniref:Uncharacterized protein n=1 Tax=Anguilla anguilla TaxID=7936 RepID=A0A0E9SZJ8_ANGAN